MFMGSNAKLRIKYTKRSSEYLRRRSIICVNQEKWSSYDCICRKVGTLQAMETDIPVYGDNCTMSKRKKKAFHSFF